MTTRPTIRLLITAGATALASTTLTATPALAASWSKVLTWEGAATQACRSIQADGNVTVQVRVNNRRGSRPAVAGLNTVRPNGNPGNNWTYTRGPATGVGKVSDVVSLTFAPTDWVYLLIGSRVGITDERTMPISRLKTC